MFPDYGNRNLRVRVLKGSISIVNTKIADGTTIPVLGSSSNDDDTPAVSDSGNHTSVGQLATEYACEVIEKL